MTKFIKTKEAAAMIGVSKPTIDRFCAEGSIPFYKPAGQRLFDVAELEKWIRGEAA